MDGKIKILFLIHTLQIGGAERVLVDTVNNLPKDKYDITVATVINLGSLKSQLAPHIRYKTIFGLKWLRKFSKNNQKYEQSPNVSTRKNPVKELFIKAYIAFWNHADLEKLYEKHLKGNYDVEVAFLEGIPAKIISKSTNNASKKIAWVHIDVINEHKSDRFFKNLQEQRETYDKFDDIVCVSEMVKKQFIKKIGIAENKARVIHNPIDENSIIKKAEAKISEPKNKFTFCTVGRLAHQKGYDRLLNIAKKLQNEGYDFKIWIIGVGMDEGKLKKIAEREHISSVEFLGYKENPYPYIKSADAFVCSSRAEGLSTVVSEAVVLGRPVITTECSGMREILGEKSEYGIICENNEDALYQEMKRALDNPDILESLSHLVKGRRQFFNLDSTVSRIDAILGEAKC